MPFKREKYPSNWEEFSRFIRFERAQNLCERCGVHNYSIVQRNGDEWNYFEDGNDEVFDIISGDKGLAMSKEYYQWSLENYADEFDEDFPRPSLIILTVAHLDRIGDICQCEANTGKKCANAFHVLALCQRCHLLYDIERHKFNRRRSRAEQIGQQWLADWDKRF